MHRLPKHDIIRVFEGFAGYGGASFGLKRSGVHHKVIGFSEMDVDAIELYEYNFPNVPNYGDITKIDPNETILDIAIITSANTKQINPICQFTINSTPSDVATPLPPLNPM